MSAQIVLLCEDRRTDSFVRRFLWHRNFRGRDVFTLPLAAGSASGEAWVRRRFPKQLRAIRARQQAVLLVVTDADTDTTSERRSHLDQQCDRCNVDRSQPNDPVIVVVPRRNIESWLHHLDTGQAIDETLDYKPTYRGLGAQDLRALADELHRLCHERQQLDRLAPPSLQAACREYPKLTRFLR